ncbi:unnamed protein product [Pleuronectes platessa]|uniref:Uncharacterized protein n=1 Tax=Pleuronectes platessa TaxID=8262 RepID=A0A9N7YQY1_PLEPL|nr:unnamed protein product [Pleuronectes platessa]
MTLSAVVTDRSTEKDETVYLKVPAPFVKNVSVRLLPRTAARSPARGRSCSETNSSPSSHQTCPRTIVSPASRTKAKMPGSSVAGGWR